jgi:hypothetical protein
MGSAVDVQTAGRDRWGTTACARVIEISLGSDDRPHARAPPEQASSAWKQLPARPGHKELRLASTV